MSIFAIGDIHGGFRALIQVLERAEIQTNDTLIFLGDYVDGWSESPQLIDYLIELSAAQHCIFIRGNHDQLFLDWLETNDKKIDEGMWFKHGGEATVNAYKNISDAKKELHIDFLKNLKDYYLDSDNRLFVHAGFTNMHGVKYEYFPKMLYWDRTLWETAVAIDTSIEKTSVFYPRRLLKYNEIYIGHTPTTQIKSAIPVNKANVWNVDTGAAFKGKLSILNIETKVFWQSDSLPELYPNENGRN